MTKKLRRRSKLEQNNLADSFQQLEPRQLLAGTVTEPIGITDVGMQIFSTDNNSAHGRLFHDSDANGVRSSGEAWLSNWGVFSDQDGDQEWEVGESFKTTDKFGRFTLPNVNGGDVTPRAALDNGIANMVLPESLVNTTTIRAQSYSDVATHDNGSVVVWTSFRQDGSGWGIFGQRYDAAGRKVGSEFQVNTTTRFSQMSPSVSAFDDGRFVVTWQSLRQDPNANFSGWGIYGQMFAADGTLLGGETRLNGTTYGHQMQPVVTTMDDGNIAVGWQGFGNVRPGYWAHGVFTSVFNDSLQRLSDEVRVSHTNFGGDRQFDMASDPTGGFVVALQGSAGPDSNGIYVRKMNADGSVNGPMSLVNQYHRGGRQWQPSIDVNDMGGMVVSWTSDFGDGSGKTVYAQMLQSNLQLSFPPALVAQEWLGTQWRSRANWIDDGYVVSWQGKGDGENDGVFLREFDSTSRTVGGEMRLSDRQQGLQRHVAMDSGPNGVVTAWHGKGDEDVFGVYSRALFVDNQAMAGSISGVVYEDENGNGRRDGGIVQGDEPDIIFVVDVSGSAGSDFVGDPVGDLNGDGSPDTILDGQIAGFELLVDELINLGFDEADLVLITYSSFSTVVNSDPLAPAQDDDGNGVPDIKDALRGLRSGGSTNYEAPLQDAIGVFNSLGTTPENGNLIFLSDGFPNTGGAFDDEVMTLNTLANNVRAFGVGNGSSLTDLSIIDPDAEIFTSTNELLDAFGGLGGGTGSGTSGGGTGGSTRELGMAGVRVFIDLDDDGMFDSNEPSVLSASDNPATAADEAGSYTFNSLLAGSYTIRQVVPNGFDQTEPADGYDITLGPDQDLRGIDFGNQPQQNET